MRGPSRRLSITRTSHPEPKRQPRDGAGHGRRPPPRKLCRLYPGVDNPHGLVATPDGEYLVDGSMLEKPP